jgi:hypothetical protein
LPAAAMNSTVHAIEKAWITSQRYAVLAENAKRQDERILFIKLCESWAKTASCLQKLLCDQNAAEKKLHFAQENGIGP